MTEHTPADDEFDRAISDRFARLERLDAPAHWDRVVTRSLEPASEHQPRGRWLAIAAAVALLAVGVIGVAISRTSSGESSVADTIESAPTLTDTDTETVGSDGSVVVTAPGASEGPRAIVEPMRVAPGDRVTITPSSPVQPTCGDVGALFDLRLGSPVRLGVLATDGTWVPESTPPTFRLCLPDVSDTPITYTIPADAPIGEVALCRSADFTLDGCGRLIVLAPSDSQEAAASVSVPVVEGLTEGEAVSVLRDLGLIVGVDRVEVQAGDPGGGRVVTQSPVGATEVDPGSEVRITIGQSIDPLTQTLIELGVDVASAPDPAAQLDGATFCGVERTGFEGFLSDDIDAGGRRCFLDHHAARLSAAFVSQNLTTEGDSVVIVMRSDPDGTTTFHVDSTKDEFGSGGWTSSRCTRLVDIGNLESSPTTFGCSSTGEPLTAPIVADPLPFPAWFEKRTDAPTCGFRGRRIADDEVADTGFDERSRRCMEDAIEGGSRAELVTVTAGDDLRVSRWIVSLGPSLFGTEQFEVASLVVDLRAGTTRWAETRCVEGEFVDGRLVGEYIVDREFVDQLDPSGTTVTDDGEVLQLPGPEDRGALQPCNGPQRVEHPFVTPFGATGIRIGDVAQRPLRFSGLNEVGAFDMTIEPSWEPAGHVESPGVIGFVRSVGLVALPGPDDPNFAEGPVVIYADDGVTRIGEFGDGGAVLDP